MLQNGPDPEKLFYKKYTQEEHDKFRPLYFLKREGYQKEAALQSAKFHPAQKLRYYSYLEDYHALKCKQEPEYTKETGHKKTTEHPLITYYQNLRTIQKTRALARSQTQDSPVLTYEEERPNIINRTPYK